MTFRVLNQAALVEMWTENQQFTNRVNHNPKMILKYLSNNTPFTLLD